MNASAARAAPRAAIRRRRRRRGVRRAIASNRAKRGSARAEPSGRRPSFTFPSGAGHRPTRSRTSISTRVRACSRTSSRPRCCRRERASAFAAQGLTASISDDHAAGVELAFIAFNDAWLQENTDTAIRFIAAYLKAARELENGGWDDPAIRDIVAKWTGLDVDVLDRIGLSEASEDGSIDEASVRAQEAYFRDAGHLTYEGDADLASIFRPDVLAAANAFLEANP